MKSMLLLLALSTCLATINTLGQTKYFKMPNGQIIDSVSYEKVKLESIEQFKKEMSVFNVRIDDFFIQEYANQDSIVYSYRWRPYDPYMLHPPRGVDQQKFIGKELPDVQLKTVDKTPFSFKQLKGKPTLVNFWFIACPPCIEELPVLNKVQQTLKDSVNFVAVTFDWRKDVARSLKDKEFNFIHITDAQWFINQLGIKRFPLTMFLDKEGKVVKMTGPVPFFLNPETKRPVPGGESRFIGILRSLL